MRDEEKWTVVSDTDENGQTAQWAECVTLDEDGQITGLFFSPVDEEGRRQATKPIVLRPEDADG